MATDKLIIGSEMPDCILPATDGKIYTLKNLIKKGLVIIFTCNHCPYVQAYENRIIDLQKKYYNDIAIAAVNSNDSEKYPEDSFENIITRSREKNFNFLYLRDEDQSVAKFFGATHTPEVFLFDVDKKLRYHGKIDDNWQDAEQVKTRYLEEAISEMLQGKEISMPETFSIGCTIKWKS